MSGYCKVVFFNSPACEARAALDGQDMCINEAGGDELIRVRRVTDGREECRDEPGRNVGWNEELYMVMRLRNGADDSSDP